MKKENLPSLIAGLIVGGLLVYGYIAINSIRALEVQNSNAIQQIVQYLNNPKQEIPPITTKEKNEK